MTAEAPPRTITPFRFGYPPGEDHAVPAMLAAPLARPAAAAPQVLLADVSEFQPNVDAAYFAWSKAIIIRALYGTDHDDLAWYNGARRDFMHANGARFVGIYQYLRSAQDGFAQAQAFNALVGAIRPGEVFICDFEEGTSAAGLHAWYNGMLSSYGSAIAPYLWTYTGLWFGQSMGVLPVEWIAAYGQGEPSTPHTLWQFTSTYPVPGVGSCDCSVFHGTIDQLAALAAPAPITTWGPPRNLAVTAGQTSAVLTRCDPPAGFTPDHYEVYIFRGSYPQAADLVFSYPRFVRQSDIPRTLGSLTPANGVTSGMHMTLRAFACDATGTAGQYADVHFPMP